MRKEIDKYCARYEKDESGEGGREDGVWGLGIVREAVMDDERLKNE